MKATIISSIIACLFTAQSFAAVVPSKEKKSDSQKIAKAEINKVLTEQLLKDFKRENISKNEIESLRDKSLKSGGQAIPALVQVMKSSDYPDKSRWVATFLVGKIMGEKSAPFIAKFTEHPNWVMRMASIKTLQALKQKEMHGPYIRLLSDKSWLVRKQALEGIKELKIEKAAPHVWAMLYDKENYYISKKSKKRTNLIKEAVKTVGDLSFDKALDPLFSMVQKSKYEDIFDEMDYALSKITNKKSPKGDMKTKRAFWKKISVSYKTI